MATVGNSKSKPPNSIMPGDCASPGLPNVGEPINNSPLRPLATTHSNRCVASRPSGLRKATSRPTALS